MKVFLSWSGQTSKSIALKLRDWLPSVIQCLQPWASNFDIEAGARWSREIEQELKDTKFGILCLTQTNLHADWILFEAGALAKTLDDSFVCPYLFRLTATQIPAGPLSQFQAKRAIKEETWQLIQSINRSLSDDKRLQDSVLQRAFEMFWPELETFLNDLPDEEIPQEARSEGDMIEEILEGVRYLRRQQEQSFKFKNILSTNQYSKFFSQNIPGDVVTKTKDGNYIIYQVKTNLSNTPVVEDDHEKDE